MSLKGFKQTKIHTSNRIDSFIKNGKTTFKYRGKKIIEDNKKLCPGCNLWKDISEYDKRPGRVNQLRPRCKTCGNKYRAAHIKDVKFYQYKSGANKRGIDFLLTKEEFLSFWNNNCHYCGDYIQTIGIDRKDSSIGYLLNNVVPCCATCNVMKLAIPRELFIEHCYKIIKHQETFATS